MWKAFLLILLALEASAQRPLPGQVANYRPIEGQERLKWFALSTLGPTSQAGGVVSAAWGTAFQSPPEYPPTWKGFGQRYGMRLTGVSTGNAIEAGLGALWGEDPRYFRSPDGAMKARITHVIKTTFLAPDSQGRWRPAYARYAGNAGNNFLSNLWREESESSAADAALRCVWGITGRMTSHAFAEFWPDVKRLFRK